MTHEHEGGPHRDGPYPPDGPRPADGPQERFAGHPRLAGHVPGDGTDTHGLPWTGRSFSPHAFSHDSGAPDPEVRAALSAVAAADPASLPGAERVLLAAMARGRLLAPVAAAPDEQGRETTSEMATICLTGPDGSRALPVFTGIDTLAAWDAGARPVPQLAAAAARAALEDGCVALLVDLRSPHAVVLRLSHLVALAEGREWLPSAVDPVVLGAIASCGAGITGLDGIRAEDGSVHAPGTLRLVLTLRDGLPDSRVDEIASLVGALLAADPRVRTRIDDVALVIHRAELPPDAPVWGDGDG